MKYGFYGADNASAKPVSDEYSKIKDPCMFYEILKEIWSRETCAPRLREKWSPENPSVGQCSVTAFLAQDIFGGRVYGILRNGGNYHCFNEADGCIFDLASEQFGDEKLDYTDCAEQKRDVHFQKEEKRLRYELLKKRLEEYLELI